jgi:hypothetical protein
LLLTTVLRKWTTRDVLHCRCQGKGCKFVGSCCEFARHLKHNVKDPSRSVWLCDYQISLKVCLYTMIAVR